MQENREYDLEERLIKFAIRMMEISERLPNTKAGNHISGQLVRSGTSPALNYGEVQAAESRADFAHKMKVILKELRETRICLKIIIQKPLIEKTYEIEPGLKECSELISIFATSIKTVEKNKITTNEK
ncbi:MAG: four helix bundle protein [Bacteroidetes bacterium CG02_land_8_20_14_3_00_31_25]|nr:four helix bundle protein [Bacteroidota bacterium]PIV57607.1 MAG: four helix bundle protein [Bacteroidetes bacterium CG02_land_8_20_14_3_00_31_25]